MKCFDFYASRDKKCLKKSCKYNIKSKCDLNCAIISAKRGPKTLQDIGKIFGVTRMRICQIEKSLLKKLRKKIDTRI